MDMIGNIKHIDGGLKDENSSRGKSKSGQKKLRNIGLSEKKSQSDGRSLSNEYESHLGSILDIVA